MNNTWTSVGRGFTNNHCAKINSRFWKKRIYHYCGRLIPLSSPNPFCLTAHASYDHDCISHSVMDVFPREVERSFCNSNDAMATTTLHLLSRLVLPRGSSSPSIQKLLRCRVERHRNQSLPGNKNSEDSTNHALLEWGGLNTLLSSLAIDKIWNSMNA